MLADIGFRIAPPATASLNASLYGFKIFSPSSIALAFVYWVASVPNRRSISFRWCRFSIPSIGLVYLTPDVSMYIPILVISDLEAAPKLPQVLRSIIRVPPVWMLPFTVIWLAIGDATVAFVSSLNIGVFTPFIVTSVNGTRSGTLIVEPSPVVFSLVPAISWISSWVPVTSEFSLSLRTCLLLVTIPLPNGDNILIVP